MKQTRRRTIRSIGTALILAAIACRSSQAANLTIKIVQQNADGTGTSGAVNEATVCFAQESGAAHGRGTTDTQGRIVFQNVPSGPIFLAAFKSGFIGKSFRTSMPSQDSFQQVALASGNGPGILCPQASASAIQGELSNVIGPRIFQLNPIHTSDSTSYIVTATNASVAGAPSSAANVRINVTFPSRFTNLSGSGDSFSCAVQNSTIVSCVTPLLSTSATKAIVVNAKVPTSVSGDSETFSITSEIDPLHALEEQNEGNNVSTVHTTVVAKGPDLTVDLNGSDTEATVGDDVHYNFTVRNGGDQSSKDPVDVVVTLPAAVAFKGVGFLLGCSHLVGAAGTTTVTCTVPAVLPGVGQAFGSIAGTVAKDTPPGTISVTAAVDPRHAIAEFDEGNNSASTNTALKLPGKPDLVVSSATSGEGFCLKSGVNVRGFHLRVTVKNQGHASSPATQVAVGLPGGLKELDSQMCAAGSRFLFDGCVCTVPQPCPPGGTGFRCSLATLAVGATATFDVTVREVDVLKNGYPVTFIVDPNSNVTEEDDSNNRKSVVVD